MSHINEKLGLKPAGQRSMMKLPDNRALRAVLTAAQCPACQHRGARISKTQPGSFWCPWCAHLWVPVP